MAITSRREHVRSYQPVPQRTVPAPMSREDICNVEPIDPAEVLAVMASMAAMEQADFECLDLDRWTLTEGGAS